jgi:hypothetical protein
MNEDGHLNLPRNFARAAMLRGVPYRSDVALVHQTERCPPPAPFTDRQSHIICDTMYYPQGTLRHTPYHVLGCVVSSTTHDVSAERDHE